MFVVPRNGIMDILIQNSVGSMSNPVYVDPPTILQQPNPITITQIEEHATLMYIYHNPNSRETAYHPVQADQLCHR